MVTAMAKAAAENKGGDDFYGDGGGGGGDGGDNSDSGVDGGGGDGDGGDGDGDSSRLQGHCHRLCDKKTVAGLNFKQPRTARTLDGADVAGSCRLSAAAQVVSLTLHKLRGDAHAPADNM